MQKILTKVGQSHTMACGCIVTRGEVVSRDPVTKRHIHEVITHQCQKCRAYNKQRTAIADEVYEDFKERKIRTKACEKASLDYLNQVQAKVAEAGLI